MLATPLNHSYKHPLSNNKNVVYTEKNSNESPAGTNNKICCFYWILLQDLDYSTPRIHMHINTLISLSKSSLVGVYTGCYWN